MKFEKRFFEDKCKAIFFFNTLIEFYKEVHLVKDYQSKYFIVLYKGDLKA